MMIRKIAILSLALLLPLTIEAQKKKRVVKKPPVVVVEEPQEDPRITNMREMTQQIIIIDVYRIGDISEMDEIGYEDYFYGDGICFVEWANLIEELLPEHYTEIVIEKNLEKGFDYRLITMTRH